MVGLLVASISRQKLLYLVEDLLLLAAIMVRDCVM